MTEKLSLHPITSPQDPFLPAWFSLYEQSFPPDERAPAEFHLRTIREGGVGEHRQAEYFAVQGGAGQLVGLAQWMWYPELACVYLCYFAISPDLRGNGLGSQVYQQLVDRLAGYPVELLVFDLEPGSLPGEEGELARRRIRFYQRLGARLLDGYVFAWPDPPLRQWMMVHPLRELPEEEILRRVRQAGAWLGGNVVEDDQSG